MLRTYWASLVTQAVKKISGGKEKKICLQYRKLGFDPWGRKIPWRRQWQPTQVLWPKKSHGEKSLAGCNPWGCKELDMTEPLAL